MSSIGPQVAFVDDVKGQIDPLDNVLKNELHTGTIFFDAALHRTEFPEKPLESIKLIFLDLFYTENFDPYLPAQWIEKIIPPNTKYSLIIWSKDIHQQNELFSILKEIGLMPEYTEAWSKADYNLEADNFSKKINALIEDIPYEEIVNTEIVLGEIIDVEEDGLLVNCILNQENPTFQVRKFDIELFKNIDIKKGVYVKICINTQPGIRRIDVFNETNDLSRHFKVPDYFKGLQGTAFFIEE